MPCPDPILTAVLPKIFEAQPETQVLYVSECCERLFVGTVPSQKCGTCNTPSKVQEYPRPKP